MAEKLVVEYDSVGDSLYITKVAPYRDQATEEIDDGILARLNPETNDVEGLEILFWSKRIEAGDVVLPLKADLRLALEV